MMRYILLFILLACFVHTEAQNRMGFKAGSTLARFRGIDDSMIEGNLRSIIGIQLGVLYDVKVNERVSIIPELNYYQKGFKVNGTSEANGIPFNFKNKFVVNYLDFPILVQYRVGDLEEVHLFFTGGPSLGYAVNAFNVARVAALGRADRERQPADLDDLAFNRFEVSLALGLGMNLPLDAGLLFFELRYLHGFTNLNEEGGSDTANHNSGFGLTFGAKVALEEIAD